MSYLRLYQLASTVSAKGLTKKTDQRLANFFDNSRRKHLPEARKTVGLNINLRGAL